MVLRYEKVIHWSIDAEGRLVLTWPLPSNSEELLPFIVDGQGSSKAKLPDTTFVVERFTNKTLSLINEDGKKVQFERIQWQK